MLSWDLVLHKPGRHLVWLCISSLHTAATCMEQWVLFLLKLFFFLYLLKQMFLCLAEYEEKHFP